MWQQKGLDLNVARDDGVCGCTDGPSMSAAQSNTVHDELLHPHVRHLTPSSAGWQVTRTAASTPQTLLVASICRVAGNTAQQYMTNCCIHTSDIAPHQHLPDGR